MKKFRLNNEGYELPSVIGECSPEQIGYILSAQVAINIAKVDREKISIKVGLLVMLSGVPLKVINQLTGLQVVRLLQEIVWCWSLKIDKKPFGSFNLVEISYLLPKDNFGNTTAIELATCNIYYLAFTRKEMPHFDAIWYIVATLCRPVRNDIAKFRKSKAWNGDEREEYNTTLAEARAELFKSSLNLGIAMAILQYFESMNNAFWKKHESLLGESNEAPMYLNGEGQITMLMEVAELGSFGDFDNVCKQPVATIWLFLKDKKLKADKAEKNSQLNNNASDDD